MNRGTDLSHPKLLFVLLIFVVSFAVYFNSLYNGFVWDDTFIEENRWIKDVKNISEIFQSDLWGFQSKATVSNYYRPVAVIIQMISYKIFGLRPWGFHLVNMLLHSAVSILVFIISGRILSRAALTYHFSSPAITSDPEGYPANRQLPAFAAALLFATHPIQTEAVIFAATELSYSLFFLLSFYLYISAKEGSMVRYAFSLMSFFVASLCKETALILPVFLMAYDYLVLSSSRSFSTNVPMSGRYLSFIQKYVPYLVVMTIYMVLRFRALGGLVPKTTTIKLSTYEYIINIFPLFMRYLEKLIIPTNLNAFYVMHPISSIVESEGILSLIVSGIFIAFIFIFSRTNRIGAFSLLALVLPLLPALYIPAGRSNVFAERYLYLPAFGFVMLIALSLCWIQINKPRLTRLAGIIIIALITAYSFGTARRNLIWKDNLTIYSDMVRKSPDASIPHYNLGETLFKLGRIDEAISEYKTAVFLNPYYINARNNLAVAYEESGRFDEAIDELKAIVTIHPNYISAHNNLGSIYEKLGRFDEAANEFTAVLKITPDNIIGHYNLGNVYFRQGQFNNAINEYAIALRLKPDDADIHNNLGFALAAAGRVDEAISEYMTALRLRPDFAGASCNLGNAYERLGRIDKALEEYEKALRLDPENAEARSNLAALARKKESLRKEH